MRLIGLDPGLQRTGWGVVEADGNSVRFLGAGVVAPPADGSLAERLDRLYRGLVHVLETQAPDAAAVEETVVNTNALSSLKLGHARGVVMLAAAHAGLPVTEYASKRIKRAVVGTGGAAKRQVLMMVRTLLPSAGPLTADAADALAVAICHAHYRAAGERLEQALAGRPAGVPPLR